jgi:two-component system, LytTR family, sensor kinase
MPAASPTRSRVFSFWVLHSAGWVVFGLVMLVWGLDYWSPKDAVINKFMLVATGFTLTLGFRSVYRRLLGRSIPVLGATMLLLSFIGALIWYEAEWMLFQLYLAWIRDLALFIQTVRISMGLWLYYGFVLFAWSLLYVGIKMWKEAEHQRDRAHRAETLVHEARLQALRSQLEPHFLFNTLNAISTLVAEGQNATATAMIAKLSDFLRLTLENADRPEIPLAEELEFVKRYLEIEQVRFGSRLRSQITADPEAMNALVPALVLQPLVENSVKHGILPREEGGELRIAVARNNGSLFISVADDGNGVARRTAPRRGIGLKNTAARLTELYGASSSFEFGEAATGGFYAHITIPYRTHAEVTP